MSLSRRVLFGAGGALALSGCVPSVGRAPTSSSSVQPSATPSASVSSADPAAIAAAAALVRADLPTLGDPVATLTIRDDSALDGAKVHLWSIRSTTGSAVLTWAITHPTERTWPLGDSVVPTLRVGGTVYRSSQSLSGAWYDVLSRQQILNLSPRPGFVLYAPLPDDVTEVTVGCDASKDTAKLTVQRGPQPPPPGTAEIPILGRVVTQDLGQPKADSTPYILTLHGVRRLEGATAVYFSVIGPAGMTPPDPLFWYYAISFPAQSSTLLGSVRLIDHPDLTGYSPIPEDAAVSVGPYMNDLHTLVTKDSAGVAWTLLPPIPAGITTVDVSIGGQYLLDIPVSDGPMSPTSAEPVTALGAGWPTIAASDLAKVSADRIATVANTLRDSVTTKSVTKTGGGNVDLDANVLFDYNKATLTSKASAVISAAVDDIVASGKTGLLTITGHTDSDGPESTNQTLSEARAQAVANALKKQLPATYTFKVIGKGEAEPIASNSTSKGRARNRRVSITLPNQ